MSTTSQGNGAYKPPYQVIVSGKIAHDLQELKKLAVAQGIGAEFAHAWESAFRRLEQNPWGYGERVKH